MEEKARARQEMESASGATYRAKHRTHCTGGARARRPAIPNLPAKESATAVQLGKLQLGQRKTLVQGKVFVTS